MRLDHAVGQELPRESPYPYVVLNFHGKRIYWGISENILIIQCRGQNLRLALWQIRSWTRPLKSA
jgi:hypothetical protein